MHFLEQSAGRGFESRPRLQYLSAPERHPMICPQCNHAKAVESEVCEKCSTPLPADDRTITGGLAGGSGKSWTRFAAKWGGAFYLYTIPLKHLLGNGGLSAPLRTASVTHRSSGVQRRATMTQAVPQDSRRTKGVVGSDCLHQATPSIHPSTSATCRSWSVRLGLKKCSRLPSRSLRRSHSAAAKASC